jgi:hypothetical protein
MKLIPASQEESKLALSKWVICDRDGDPAISWGFRSKVTALSNEAASLEVFDGATLRRRVTIRVVGKLEGQYPDLFGVLDEESPYGEVFVSGSALWRYLFADLIPELT